MLTSPHTPREFANARIPVRVLCRCGHEKRIDPMDIEFLYGEHFDLAHGWAELSGQLHCEACGDRPVIAFGEPEQEASFESQADFVTERPSRRIVASRGRGAST